MTRKLLILALGILFLVIIVWLGTTFTEIIPSRPSAQVQVTQVGSYQITMQVNPNPPSPTMPAIITIQVVHRSTQQLVTNAKITVESSMETMDMGTDVAHAQLQSTGMYTVPVHFAMNGPWQVRVLIAIPGVSDTTNATFEVTAR